MANKLFCLSTNSGSVEITLLKKKERIVSWIRFNLISFSFFHDEKKINLGTHSTRSKFWINTWDNGHNFTVLNHLKTVPIYSGL